MSGAQCLTLRQLLEEVDILMLAKLFFDVTVLAPLPGFLVK